MPRSTNTLKRQRASAADALDKTASPEPASMKKRRLNNSSARQTTSNSISLAVDKNTSIDAAYEVPDSDEERTVKSKAPAKTTSSPAARAQLKSATAKKADMYELENSDAEQESAATPQKKNGTLQAPASGGTARRRGRPPASEKKSIRGTAAPSIKTSQSVVEEPVVEAETPSKRRPGRPRKNEARPTVNASGIGDLFPPEALQNPAMISSKLVPRKKKAPPKKAKEENLEQPISKEKGKKTAAATPKSDTPMELVFEDLPSRTTSKRTVKPSIKVLEMQADNMRAVARDSPKPAQAKAPLKGRRRPKASKPAVAAAEEKETAEEEVEDVEESLDDPTAEVEAESADELAETQDDEADVEEQPGAAVVDDEVCAICSKPDSRARNQIIFCDSCDKAVHQKCYGVPVVPKGDWFCRDCAPPEEDSDEAVVGDKLVLAKTTPVASLPDIPNIGEHLQKAQRVLVDRCTGRRRIKMRGQADAYEKTYQLVEQTIVAGEGNSMMVIGPRGSGKTTLVESVLDEMIATHLGEFHVVRLNGFIHTDDKLAVRDIWQQLGKELEEQEELVAKTNNYADTMAYLLSLLSHPSDFDQGQEGMTSQSVIFVIDEFDLFATHGRQTLLYNLFDFAQAKKAPIAILGLTTRIDVVESLEKRVKSRFSHRYVHLSQPKSVPAFWDICKHGLTIDEEDMVAEGIDSSAQGHDAFWEWWNKHIDALYKSQSFRDHLEFHFHSTKSVPGFLTSCILPLTQLSLASPVLQIPSDSISLEPPDSNLHVMQSLSSLDLAMLICAARLDVIAHTDVVNFAMVYDEYTSLMSKLRVQSAAAGMVAAGGQARVWGRGVAAVAWERLIGLGLLLPAGVGRGGGAGQAGAESKMWKVDTVLEEIPGAAELDSVLTKWCKEI